MHRRVITVGKDLETELNHAADRVLDRPFFIRESAQIVGIGRHHGKRDAPIRGALSELRIVCNRVAVVDSLTLEGSMAVSTLRQCSPNSPACAVNLKPASRASR